MVNINDPKQNKKYNQKKTTKEKQTKPKTKQIVTVV